MLEQTVQEVPLLHPPREDAVQQLMMAFHFKVMESAALALVGFCVCGWTITSWFISLTAVHGFGNTAYSVQEGEALNILFELNVKGMTQFGSSLFIPGNVTVEYDSSESEKLQKFLICKKFVYHYSLGPVLLHQVSSSNAISVQLIALYVQSNKTITLRFTPDNPAFVPGLEGVGEYVRDTAVVNVTNNEGKLILGFNVFAFFAGTSINKITNLTAPS